VKIVASGDLNEWKIDELMRKGAKIDLFGVGTELITGRPAPALDGIYKLSEVAEHSRHVPKMKLSEETVKATLPGKKRVWRIVEDGEFVKDVISLDDEVMDDAVPLLEPVVKSGKLICNRPSLVQIRETATRNLAKLPDEYKKLEGAPTYPVEFSSGLTALRERLVKKIRLEEIGLKI
jgi:nicotinate phosphoribosyltransferase